MNNRPRIVFTPDKQGSNTASTPAASRTANRRGFRRWVPRLFLPAALVLLLCPCPGVCQDEPAAVSAPGSVTVGTLEARVAEVEAATGIEEQAKTKLLELYRKALGNLQTASSNAEATEGFRRAGETAPARIQAIREAMEKAAATPPEDTLDIDPSTPLRQVEQLLQKEKADLAAVGAKRADFEKRLEEEAGRPAVVRQRLTDAAEQQEEVAAQLKLPPPAAEGPATVEARRWALETRFDALSNEIKMLDQELLSRPERVELLEAERDQAAASVRWVGARAKQLEQLVNLKRKDEAEQSKTKAEAIRQEAAGKFPRVTRLAEENAALSAELADMSSRLDGLAEQAEQTGTLARQIETSFKRVKDAIEIGGLSQELGYMLRRQRQALPGIRAYRRAAKELRDDAAELGARRLRHLEEETQLRDLDAYVAGVLADTGAEETPVLRERLRDLGHDRKDLLKTDKDADDVYLGKLGELESAQRRLLDAIQDYGAFLDEHLLWVRSKSLFQLDQLDPSSDQLWRILSPIGWREVGRTLAYQAANSPVYALFAVGVALLLWGRKRLVAAIRDLSGKLGKPTTDRFGYSLLALALTLVMAAAWPLAMGVIGWQLKVSSEATDFTTAVGISLLAAAAHLYHLRAFRLACIPGGLAAAHFRWPESTLRLLRKELDRFTWIFLPTALAAKITSILDPLDETWASGRLFFFLALGSLAFAFYRVLHPARGAFARYLRGRQRQTLKRVYRLGYPLLVAYPLALGVLSLMGYRYTAGTLTELLLETVWLVVTLVFIAALAKRWLSVTRRRLAYEAATERRADAALRGGEEGHPHEGEEPEVDVVALSDRSRKLVNTAILLFAFFGLWFIWSEVFPALRILDQVTLWHHTVTVDGEDKVLPITLASIGLALIYAVITVILARQLPAVLEIILLQYTKMSAGSRYTVTTLTNYAIVTTGIILVFQTIGTDWSQLQWLVAALGVGIGFGLQEIVANFISGVIILFERPIRIGDVVTVGDTDGTVTRIRGRATTIRSWDGKELLVPNKEFITGRLLNWSLSDQATRIVLSVGIAYGSDVRQAMRLLEEAARENENVLDDPAPSVIFESFGDNSLGLLLRCFVDSVDIRYPTMSALNGTVNDKFNAAGIVIAFPQRDLHLDTIRPLQVELRRGKEYVRDRDPGAAGDGQ